MMFTTIRPALLALVKSLMGPTVDAYWRDQTDRYIPQGSKTVFKLSLGPSTGKGLNDDKRVEYDPTAPLNQELTENVTGYRLFTMKALCECLNQTDGSTANNYLETLRTRLRFSTSSDALHVVNVSLVSIGDILDLSKVQDGRQTSIGNLDIRLSTRTNERNTDGRGGYIATVDTPTLVP